MSQTITSGEFPGAAAAAAGGGEVSIRSPKTAETAARAAQASAVRRIRSNMSNLLPSSIGVRTFPMHREAHPETLFQRETGDRRQLGLTRENGWAKARNMRQLPPP